MEMNILTLKDDKTKSRYLEVKTRPKNKQVSLACSSMLVSLACINISKEKQSFQGFVQDFLEALGSCKDEKDLEELRSFMQELSQTMEVAREFYQQFEKTISLKGIEFARQKLREISKQYDTFEEEKKPLEVVVEFEQKLQKCTLELQDIEQSLILEEDTLYDLLYCFRNLEKNLQEIRPPAVNRERYLEYQNQIQQSLQKLKKWIASIDGVEGSLAKAF